MTAARATAMRFPAVAGARGACLYNAVLMLLLCLLASCALPGARRGEAVPRAHLPPGKPVVLWVDWVPLGESLSTEDGAAAFCREARLAGVSALALEAVGRDGTLVPGSTTTAGRAWDAMVAAAPRHGLRLGAVFNAMVAPPDAPPQRLAQRATWDADGNLIVSTSMASPAGPLRYSLADAAAVAADMDRLARVAARPELAFVIVEGVGSHDLQSDLSPAAQTAFQSAAGVTVRRWPADVLGEAPPVYPLDHRARGPYWNAWLTWRAEAARQYMVKVKEQMVTMGTEPPRVIALVDGPYAGHVREGLNWVHPLAGAQGENRWLPEGYGRTAAGHLMDGVALGIWEPGLLSVSQAEQHGYAWWGSLEAISAGAQRYRGPGTTQWGAVPVGGTGWLAAARAAWELNDGILLISGGVLSRTPEGVEGLRRAWQ